MTSAKPPKFSSVELFRLVFSSVVSAVVASLVMRPASARDIVTALFVAGVFLSLAELWCDDDA